MADFSELGASGLRISGGVVGEEFLPSLMGKRANQVYAEMATNEPLIGGIQLAFEQVAGRLDWHIEPPEEATPAEEDATEFIESAWGDMADTWDTVLSSIFSFLPYGWSFFEVNYKIRKGRDARGEPSRYSDNKIGWANWSIRSQDSLEQWIIGDHGSIDGLRQMDPASGRIIDIPMDKALLFRTSEYKNNPQGKSMLRNAYVPYFYLKRLREYEAIGVERDLAGMPIVDLPAAWFESTATNDQKAAIANMQRMVADVKDNRRKGLVIPTAYDEHGNRLIDFRLLASEGGHAHNTSDIIMRYKQEMAMSLLSDYLLLGHDRVGTYNLGTAKIDQWVMVVDSLCKSITDVVNKHAIEKLLRINGFDYTNPPTLTYGRVNNVDLGQISTFLTALNGAGLITYDPSLEAWAREVGGMPVLDEEFADLHEQQERDKLEAPAIPPALQAANAAPTEPGARKPPEPATPKGADNVGPGADLRQ